MAKKYTSKQISEIMRFVLLGAFEHIEAIKTEIRKIGPIDESSDPSLLQRAKIMHLTLTCINDIIHPAHVLAHSFFGDENKEFIDLLVKNHQMAVEKKLVPECYCFSCDPDKQKARAKIDALKKAEKVSDEEVGLA